MSNRKKWHVLYYEDQRGKSPVYEMVEGRSLREKAKILNWIELLQEHGPHLSRPYADLLVDGIHELRIKLTGDQVRVLYFFCFQDVIVLTNCFTKNTSKVPAMEIQKAKACREDFLRRFNEARIRKVIDENI